MSDPATAAPPPVLRTTDDGRVGFWCPGCNHPHFIPVATLANPGTNWGYDGNTEAPTFTPSILVTQGHHVPGWQGSTCWCNSKDPPGEDWRFTCGVCHSFVTAGKILFLGDCTHALAGQSVPLPPFPADRF